MLARSPNIRQLPVCSLELSNDPPPSSLSALQGIGTTPKMHSKPKPLAHHICDNCSFKKPLKIFPVVQACQGSYRFAMRTDIQRSSKSAKLSGP